MRKFVALVASAAFVSLLPAAAVAQPDEGAKSWLDPSLSSEARARAAVAAMTLDEKLRLIFGYSDQAVTDVAKVPVWPQP